jgi:aspartate-semialdehyde dehydrogenase
MKLNCAIVGATGAVGQEILHLLEQKDFPLHSLRCFASPASAGKKVVFKSREIPIEQLSEKSFEDIDLAFFAAGKEVSKKYIPLALESGAYVIDSSSAFRKDPSIPLIIPEINPHHIEDARLISSPNCTASIMLMVLAPLHKKYPIKRIIASTYQAFSGAGLKEMEKLKNETLHYLTEQKPSSYAFNLFLHPSQMGADDYVEEEKKMIEETHKILGDPTIAISATCVRVPILRVHALSLNVEFAEKMSKEEALSLLASAPGIEYLENPTPARVAGKENVCYGRIRKDLSHPNTLEFWVLGDQLLKGAALNAVQIGEHLWHSRLRWAQKRPIFH